MFYRQSEQRELWEMERANKEGVREIAIGRVITLLEEWGSALWFDTGIISTQG